MDAVVCRGTMHGVFETHVGFKCAKECLNDELFAEQLLVEHEH